MCELDLGTCKMLVAVPVTHLEEAAEHQMQALLTVLLCRCGPCKVMLPHLEQMSGELGESVKMVKFNCSKENKELGKELGIRVAPTFQLYRQSKKVRNETLCLGSPTGLGVAWVTKQLQGKLLGAAFVQLHTRGCAQTALASAFSASGTLSCTLTQLTLVCVCRSRRCLAPRWTRSRRS